MRSFLKEKTDRRDTKTESLSVFFKLLHFLYDVFYYVGMVFLRFLHRFRKRIVDISMQAHRVIWSRLKLFGELCKRGFTFVVEEVVGIAFSMVYGPYSFFKKLHKARKANGWAFMWQTAKNIIKNSYRPFMKDFRVFLCYVAPIVASIVLFQIVSNATSIDYVVAVNYDGKLLGYVRDETVYNNAEKLVQDRIVYDNQEPINFVPEFQIAKLNNDEKISDEYEICNRLIEATGEEITEAFGLYVDGKFYGATTDGASLAQVLDGMLTTYTSGIENETVSFVNNVQVKDGLYPESSIVPQSKLETLIASEVEGERTYTIVSGDSPIRIAKKNGITLRQLRALNPDIDTNCFIGDEVLIANSQPFLAVQVARIETYEVPLKYKTISQNSNKYAKGTTKVVVAGEEGLARETAEKVYVDGILQETNVLETVTLKAPVNREVLIGTYVNTTASSGSGKYSGDFIWPVDGGYVSCHINGYKGHTGMDIAAARGTKIRASMAGRVIRVKKLNYGYGYHVMIDHGNGVQTLYAHCSSISVKVGDYVDQGDVIARVGSTGNSTGNHCHFEIRINGSYKNPAKYVGSKYNR